MNSVVHNRNIVIDPEFKNRIRRLDDDEYAQLEANILADGCREPLVVWRGKNILVDGHHRYEICNRHGLPFEVIEREFDCREAVLVWIIENQLGRRNLPEPARIKYALELKPAIAALAEARMKAGTKQDPVANLPQGKTRDVLADKAGVSGRKFDYAKTLLTKAPDFLREWYETSVVTAHGGYQLYKALEGAHEDVVAVVAKWQVVDHNTIPLLIKQHNRGGETWQEIRDSGYVQPGEEYEAVSVTAGAKAVADAIALKAQIHKQLVRDVRIATEDAAAAAADTTPETPATIVYERGDVVWLAGHLLICDDNRSALVRSILETEGAALAFCDPPYNAGVAEWDGGFTWEQDFLIDYADIVAVTPGIGNLPDFFRRTTMPYKWSVSAHISNGMTRGALGFGNWIYTALFAKASIHRDRQDITTVAIQTSDSDELGEKRQKPSRYLAWLFGLLTHKGDTIIDAFGGSGNAVIVAHELGRRCISIEKDPDTFNRMVARVSAAIGETAILKEGI